MKVEVLGTGCKKCETTAERISAAAERLGVSADVTKVTDPAAIMQYKVMATPAVAVDGEVVHSGSVPDAQTIEQWLRD